MTCRRKRLNKYGFSVSLSLSFTSACSVEDGVIGRLERASAVGIAGATSGTGTAGATSGTAGSTQDCALTSPAVVLRNVDETATYATCTGRIASTHFTNALCVCGDVEVADQLVTRGFDSSLGRYVSEQADDSGAAVAINGGYRALSGYTDIGGSLSVAGAGGVDFVGFLAVRGDLRAGGVINVTGYTSVARNAWLSSAFWGLGPVTIGGELHHASSVTALPLVAGSSISEAVTVLPPCPCAPRELLNVVGLVEQVASENDNAQFGLVENQLESVVSATTLALPCGRFYLSRIAGSGNVTLRITGMVALFLEDGIDLDGALAVELAPGAEFDLFVRNDVRVAGTITLANEERPSAGRLYVGGSSDVVLQSPLIGNLYAPFARVRAAGDQNVWGSVFSQTFIGSGSANFVFDRAIELTGRSCDAQRPPVGACTQCGSCYGGTACVEGECGPCRTDADCCSQNVCVNGKCSLLVTIQ